MSAADWEVAAVIVLWAYALAFLPAAATGPAWCYVFRRLSTNSSTPLTRFAIGVAIGTGIATLGGLAVEHLALGEKPNLVGLFATCGAAAGGVLAVLFPRESWQRTPSSDLLEDSAID